MRNATFPIPAAELPLVEASLDQCPGLRLLGVHRYSSGGAAYCDLFFTYHQENDLYQLGCCVGRALEQLAVGEEVAAAHA